ncbi:MAG: hypothetical protein NWE78_01460 [Candidatus Bathyarchaeota archaeon]|nr:hypothetical protein [Candidatus Bathyarchaeota archaeon]
MRFKITNGLKKTDYRRLSELFKNSTGFSFEFFPSIDFEHVSVSLTTVAVEGSRFKIVAEASFTEPIGFEVCDNLGLESETHVDLTINRRNFIISKIVTEQADFEKDLNMILRIMERVVNIVCALFDTQVEKVITLNSESLDTQLEMTLQREELEKRGEIPRPFGTIHAKDSRDAKERAGGLIALYKERDKTYLYDAKQVYYLLPHDFVTSLLRCDATTLVRQEEFDNRGKEVLRDLFYRKFLKKRELLDGTVCYYGLDEKTQRYLKRHLEHKTPRR